MYKNLLSFILISSISFIGHSENITVMSINVQNLFDTIDDQGKDDKAFLPIEMKQSQKHRNSCNSIIVKRWRAECFFQDWNEKTKNAKLRNILKVIISYNNSGADVIGLQEIENMNILEQLFNLLEPYGYIDFHLLESNDKRGIDTAFISKYKISNPKLHYVDFSPNFETIDTRPIFEINVKINEKILKFYNVHFPSNFHPAQMRIESFEKLKELIASHDMPSVALGDFNLTNKDDRKFNIYQNQEDYWYVAHREACSSCLGTYYYGRGKSWDFLDTIMVSKNRGVELVKDSVDVFKIELNTYKDTGKPHWFDPESKKGVSDHFPFVAEITLQ